MPIRYFAGLAIAAATVMATPRVVRAQLRVAVPVMELGEVRGGQRLQKQFELSNTGATPIDIVEVRRGCGCLAPRLAETKLTPGARTTLEIELRTLGQADGPHAWNAQVVYRADGEVKIAPLELRGTVRNEVLVQPAILALHIDKDSGSEITLVDRRTKPLRVVGAEARSRAVKVAEIVRDGQTTRVILKAQVDALEPGRYEGMLFVFTDDRDYEELQIPVTVTKGRRAAVQIVPERPQARIAAGAASGSALVRLRSLTGRPIGVTEVKTNDPAAKCTWAAGPGNDATLRVQLSSSAAGNMVEVRVLMERSESLTVPIEIVRD